jgi:hypothetical protein
MARRMTYFERAAREVLEKPAATGRAEKPKKKITLPKLNFMERDMPPDIAPHKPKPVRR